VKIERIVTTSADLVADQRKLRADMKARGYKPLGAGCFGQAFEHPTNPKLVVKVGAGAGARLSCPDDRKPLDGYADWLTTVGENISAGLDSVFFPRVLSAKIITSTVQLDHSAYIVTMERLTPVPWGMSDADLGLLLQRIDPRIKTLRTLEKWAAEERIEDLGLRTMSAKVLLRALGSTYERHASDLHRGNVMLRKVGAMVLPVITDPAV
jgi:hypothetical protein